MGARDYKHHDLTISKNLTDLVRGDRVEVALDKKTHVAGVVKVVQSGSALISVGGLALWFYPMSQGGLTAAIVR